MVRGGPRSNPAAVEPAPAVYKTKKCFPIDRANHQPEKKNRLPFAVLSRPKKYCQRARSLFRRPKARTITNHSLGLSTLWWLWRPPAPPGPPPPPPPPPPPL